MSTDLAAAVAQAWAEEQRFVASLSAAERTAKGTHDDWSPKDLVAHVAAAKRRLVRAIDGELVTLEHDERSVYAAHERDSWEEAKAASARAAADLLDQIGRQVDAPWLQGRSLESFVAGYAIRHPLGHIADYHDARGGTAEAERVRLAAEAILATLPPQVAHPTG